MKSALRPRSRRFSQAASKRRLTRQPRAIPLAPQIELLEERTLLTISSSFIPATNTLEVSSDTNDPIIITVNGSVLINGALPADGPLDPNMVQELVIHGGNSENVIDLTGVLNSNFPNLSNAKITVDGGDADDSILASPIGGVYRGGNGDDLITGGISNDTIDGGNGNDTITGGDGKDSIIGGDGNDNINGGLMSDVIFAGDGQDVVRGGFGNDTINSGAGLDTVFGNEGDDFINGSSGNDLVYGGDGADSIFGGADDDTLIGNMGNDSLIGQSGDDLLIGGNTIIDTLVNDGEDTLFGSMGNDTLFGGTANDSLTGSGGDDVIDGEDGDDTLNGNAGNDYLDGGRDEDRIFGGSNNDTLIGGFDDDTLRGQSGDDSLNGGAGIDSLHGGSGNDILEASPLQLVFLDFETGFDIGEHIYLDEDLNENGLLDFGEDSNGNKRLDDDPTAIQRMLEDDFSNYEVRFTQTRPTRGDFITVVFNGTPDFPPNSVPFLGIGQASEIDFRNTRTSGDVSIDLNNFLAPVIDMLPDPNNVPVVRNLFNTASAFVSAHEVGHLMGLRNFDANSVLGFNPATGQPFGISSFTGLNSGFDLFEGDFTPIFPGPSDASETDQNLMSAFTMIAISEDINGDGILNLGEDRGNGILDLAEDINMNGILDPAEDINGNTILDPGEDINMNGRLDPSEDRNGNGILDPSEDLNGNGILDPGEDRGNGILDPPEDRGNGLLDLGEDRNGNGILDPGEDDPPNGNSNGILDPGEDIIIPNGILDPPEDVNGNGILDPSEDLNGNGLLDPGEDRGNGVLDLGEDLNNNGILDPGEDVNMNGRLDFSEDVNGNGLLDPGEDFDRDGVLDLGEDLNGNGIIDTNIFIVDLRMNAAFAERAAIKLAIADTGNLIREVDQDDEGVGVSSPKTFVNPQPVELRRLGTPNPMTSGTNSIFEFDVEAGVVWDGRLTQSAVRDDDDFYAFTGVAGEMVNIEVNSFLLDRMRDDPLSVEGLDQRVNTILRVFDSSGQLVPYFAGRAPGETGPFTGPLARQQFLDRMRTDSAVNDEFDDSNASIPEDLNGNGVLDPGEDINGNGILDSATYDGPLQRTAEYPAGQVIRNAAKDPIIISLELPDTDGNPFNEETFIIMVSEPYQRGIFAIPVDDIDPVTGMGLNHIVELDPITGVELKRFPAPIDTTSFSIGGASLALDASDPDPTKHVLYYMNTTFPSPPLFPPVPNNRLRSTLFVLSPDSDDLNRNDRLDPGEDRLGDGILFPGEDINGNGMLDAGEDLNNNGILDPSEDLDGDGILDPGEDLLDGVISPAGTVIHEVLIDFAGAGVNPLNVDGMAFLPSEDLNGNGMLDPGEDSDGNGLLDAARLFMVDIVNDDFLIINPVTGAVTVIDIDDIAFNLRNNVERRTFNNFQTVGTNFTSLFPNGGGGVVSPTAPDPSPPPVGSTGRVLRLVQPLPHTPFAAPPLLNLSPMNVGFDATSFGDPDDIVAQFEFEMTTPPAFPFVGFTAPSEPGEGFAFGLIETASYGITGPAPPLPTAGAGIGSPATVQNLGGIEAAFGNALTVVFDTRDNDGPITNDPDDNHVTVYLDGVKLRMTNGLLDTTVPFNLDDANPHNVRITLQARDRSGQPSVPGLGLPIGFIGSDLIIDIDQGAFTIATFLPQIPVVPPFPFIPLNGAVGREFETAVGESRVAFWGNIAQTPQDAFQAVDIDNLQVDFGVPIVRDVGPGLAAVRRIPTSFNSPDTLLDRILLSDIDEFGNQVIHEVNPTTGAVTSTFRPDTSQGALRQYDAIGAAHLHNSGFTADGDRVGTQIFLGTGDNVGGANGNIVHAFNREGGINPVTGLPQSGFTQSIPLNSRFRPVFGNGDLDLGEDVGNGRLDPGEDLNGDGVLDPGEDRNPNGILDPGEESFGFIANVSSLTLMPDPEGDPAFRLTPEGTPLYNVTAFGADDNVQNRTNIGDLGEDLNGDGILDLGEDRNSNGILDPAEDINMNGILDPGEDIGNGRLDPNEDLNLNGILDPGEDIGNGILDPAEDRGNGVLDLAEDINGNGILDLGEDRNRNGVLDPSEDLNGNGILDPGEDRGNGILDQGEDIVGNGILDLGEDVNGNGILDLSEDRNRNLFLDPGEDLNGNGILDFGEDRGNGVLDPAEDLNGNGILDPNEDRNGNGILDPAEDVGNGIIDPGEDRNGNGILDPAEDGRLAAAIPMFPFNIINGILDTEDVNGNRILDPGEDLNNNGFIDSEDIGNGRLDPGEDSNFNGILDPGEDLGNGALDPAEDLNGNGILDIEDRNMNGILETEDANGNGILDPGEDGSFPSLFGGPNGILDREDIPNGILDPGEDIGNGRLDFSEDTNNNGVLDPFEDRGNGVLDNNDSGNYELLIYKFLTGPGIVDMGVGETLRGGSGNDTIKGSSSNDLILGNSGDDFIDGGAGKDLILGGTGNDTLLGGNGDDTLNGQKGVDEFFGGNGDDHFIVDMESDTDGTVEGGLGTDRVTLLTGAESETIRVESMGNQVRVTITHPTDPIGRHFDLEVIEELEIMSVRGDDTVIVTDLTGVIELQRLIFHLGGGNDSLNASAQLSPFVRIDAFGENGADTLVAGNGRSLFRGGIGRDSLVGGRADDTLEGDMGVDSLFGGEGNDVLFGGDRNDILRGQGGNDSLNGDGGNDRLFGGTGADSLVGELGDDTLLGQDGADTLEGNEGDDTLNGGNGNDLLFGNLGVDSLIGGDDDDTLSGGVGDDRLLGGRGSDFLQGDADNDFLNGNSGKDVLQGGDGNDVLLGGSGSDDLDGDFGNDTVNGNSGRDSIRGGDGNDLLTGGVGNDTLNGGDGFDTLQGEAGNDALAGHDGDDSLLGGAGNDTLIAGNGNDTLRGGDDPDFLVGGQGDDTLDGEGGIDTLSSGEGFDTMTGVAEDVIDESIELFFNPNNPQFAWIDQT